MTCFKSHIVSLAATVFCVSCFAQGWYEESNGQIVVEAENFHAKFDRKAGSVTLLHYWELKTDKSGYSRDGFMQILPDERCETCNSPSSPRDNSGAELMWRIKVNTAGIYKVWVRGMSMGGESNGIHIGIDGVLPGGGAGSNMSGFRPYNSWVWEHGHKDYSVEPNIYISAGEHTLHAWQRDDGFRFDKLLLGINHNGAPSGLGPDESSMVSDPTNAAGRRVRPAGRRMQDLSPGALYDLHGRLEGVARNTSRPGVFMRVQSVGLRVLGKTVMLGE